MRRVLVWINQPPTHEEGGHKAYYHPSRPRLDGLVHVPKGDSGGHDAEGLLIQLSDETALRITLDENTDIVVEWD